MLPLRDPPATVLPMCETARSGNETIRTDSVTDGFDVTDVAEAPELLG